MLFRVGEDEPGDTRRRDAMECKRRVATHRQTGNHGRFHAQRGHQRVHVTSVVLDERRPAVVTRLAQAGKIGSDRAPAVRHRLDLTRPHGRRQRKGM